jgi:type I restriction enzyme M protein
MALKKSQLYSSLWASCDELRGGMDASQYKDYILTLLFMKYVTDKAAADPTFLIDVPEGGGFNDMVRLRGKTNIGEGINTIIARLAEANDLKGVIDQADFDDAGKLGSGKEMQDRLSKLIGIFENIDLRANRAEGDDLLGDAYEYLMKNFATESGKSKGQFYTPAEVSRIMAKVIGLGGHTTPQETIYDMACGSGSLLLKAADEALGNITIYGQEMDVATWSLAKMNMILHGHPDAELWRGNTLSDPRFRGDAHAAHGATTLRTFDYAVANPPFSTKSWTSGVDPVNDPFNRFVYGTPPAKNGDYAFLLHMLASLKSTGTGAIILPHGVLFRGNKEADIRRNLESAASSRGSSASRPTSSSAPAFPRRSSSWTRVAPPAGTRSSWSTRARASSRRAPKTASAPRISTASWTPSPTPGRSPGTPAPSPSRKSPTPPTTTTSTSRATSTPPSRRTSTTSQATSPVASPP